MPAFIATGPTAGGYPFGPAAADAAVPLAPQDRMLAGALAVGALSWPTVSIAFSGAALSRERWELHGWKVREVAA